MQEEITATEAARLTGHSDRTIRRWIKSGKLPARQLAANRYAILVTDLDQLAGRSTVSALVARLNTLERRVSALESGIVRENPETSRTIPDTLPPGSIPLVDFARAKGLPVRTLTEHARAGRIACTTLDQGRPVYWLTPEQQEQFSAPTGPLPKV